ncbi:MAG TPA: DNA repair protein RecN [Acidimicrobiales bacterium]|nr:DNA repair protein RecN [Acidimicrobiales bacterium]
MLVELRVSQLGVIDDVTVVLEGGLTALTGETGAGKTLIVDAIQLLTGGPADPALVRPGAREALVEGRFSRAAPGPPRASGDGGGAGEDDGDGDGEGDDDGDGEVILTRVVPASGRSRCYINGRMVPVAQLSELGRSLVDIHGQHAAQSLLSAAVQRDTLDAAAALDTTEVEDRRRRVRELRAAQATLGGDARARARELDLLSYQLREIEAADIADPEEDRTLLKEEEALADTAGLVEAAGAAWQALAGEDGVVERLGAVVTATSTRRPLGELHRRLAGLQEDLADAAGEARMLAESVEGDPDRLDRIGERRRVLTEMRRKYGGSLAEVIAYRKQLRSSVAELLSHDERAAAIEADLARAEEELTAARKRLWEARRAAAPDLSRQIETELRQLAMPRARFEVEVGPDPRHDSVTWLFGANPGEPMLPLTKVASGGELARAMLAARLVMGRRVAGTDPARAGAVGPATLVFDEVDAGIGGEAASAVGRALAAIGADHQVLVVTHLAQVAAFAARQVAVTKEVARAEDGGERTVARVEAVDGPDRVVELARMMSGRPDSDSARRHAEELLDGSDRPGRTEGRRNRPNRSTSQVRDRR